MELANLEPTVPPYDTISGNLVYDITDHLPNFLIINMLSCTSHKIDTYRRDFSGYCENDLIEEVREVSWGGWPAC